MFLVAFQCLCLGSDLSERNFGHLYTPDSVGGLGGLSISVPAQLWTVHVTLKPLYFERDDSNIQLC